LPSGLLRGRITRALYAKAGYLDLVVDSEQDYIDLAVALGTDAERRERAEAEIAAACAVLFEDEAEVRDFEGFLADAVEGA